MTTTRNAAIVAAISTGRSGADVAREFGVTRERIRQIWTGETGRQIARLPGAGCPRCGGRRSEPAHGQTARHRDAQQMRAVRRFWTRVNRDGPVPEYDPTLGPCWLWTASTYPTGYGHSILFRLGYAHRVSYRLVKGPIPEGMTLDHLCRVPLCVNPDHLEAVTHRVNVLRSPIAQAAINARKTHCIHGHEFSPENTYRFGNGRHRTCRACVLNRNRLIRQRQRQVA
jgi:hypothetical protein